MAGERQPVMHGDHEALCLCCRHCYFSEAMRGYSEMTPPEPMSVNCKKGHGLELSEFRDQGDWHDQIHLSQSCGDFDGR